MSDPEEPSHPAANGPSQDAPTGELSPARVDDFVRLLGENQRRITLYVVGLVPNWNEAEEIVQETTVVLWQEFNRFEPGTNFVAWACRVAYFRVLAWRKKRSREKIQFSSEFLSAISEELAAEPERMEERERQLAECVEKLPPDHRKILVLRYGENCPIDQLAERAGRTVAASYRLLSRIRHNLYDCVGLALVPEKRL